MAFCTALFRDCVIPLCKMKAVRILRRGLPVLLCVLIQCIAHRNRIIREQPAPPQRLPEPVLMIISPCVKRLFVFPEIHAEVRIRILRTPVIGASEERPIVLQPFRQLTALSVKLRPARFIPKRHLKDHRDHRLFPVSVHAVSCHRILFSLARHGPVIVAPATSPETHRDMCIIQRFEW